MGNSTVGLFDNSPTEHSEIANIVGNDPGGRLGTPGSSSMIRQISETANLPIAGVISPFCNDYELDTDVIERNKPPRKRTHGCFWQAQTLWLWRDDPKDIKHSKYQSWYGSMEMCRRVKCGIIQNGGTGRLMPKAKMETVL